MKKVFVLFIILAIWTPLGHGQQAAATQGGIVQQAGEDRVSKVYEIKWRASEDIRLLLEGFGGHGIRSNSTLNTLTVTATEKLHVLIAELIRKYDVPVKTIEFQFFLIRALPSGEGLRDGVPPKVRKVIGEVAALTRYKSFEVMDTPVLRVDEGKEAGLTGGGPYSYSLKLGRGGATLLAKEEGQRQIRVNFFEVFFSVPAGLDESAKKQVMRNVGVSTSFTVADGETIVLGASQMLDDPKGQSTGVITVVTAKVLN